MKNEHIPKVSQLIDSVAWEYFPRRLSEFVLITNRVQTIVRALQVAS